MLIAFFENNLQADGSVKIPEPLQPYMGGQKSMLLIAFNNAVEAAEKDREAKMGEATKGLNIPGM